MNWTTQVDALAATIAQRDANATWEAVSQEFAPALAQYRDMLGSSEDVTLYCAKRVIKRTWDMQYLNKVRWSGCGDGWMGVPVSVCVRKE